MAAWRSVREAAIPFGVTRRLDARKPFPGTPRSKNFWPAPSAGIFPCRLRLVADGCYCELPREVTDAVGNVLARYEYDPYGRRTLVAGTDLADFGYTGHYVHKPSGLHLALYRAYDADLGRWLNRDPIEEEGGINLYGYVENNTINQVDLMGLQRGMPTTRPTPGVRPVVRHPDDGHAINPPGLRNPTRANQAIGSLAELLDEWGVFDSGKGMKCNAEAEYYRKSGPNPV